MKRKLTLIATGVLIAFGSNTMPVAAYETHEYPFFQDENLKTMSQKEGNDYCRNKFNELKAAGNFDKFHPDYVTHVWAHKENGECIANTRRYVPRSKTPGSWR